MERVSMTSTFIAGNGARSQNDPLKPARGKQCMQIGSGRGEVVTPGRLELPTRSLGNCCSIHLSYGATFRMNELQYNKK